MSMLKGGNVPVPAPAVRVEVGWRPAPGTPDVDASALLLVSGRVRGDADFVFYNQPEHASGAVRHEGKRPAGAAMTDVLHVDLAAVEPAVDSVVLAASADGGTFGGVPGLHVRVLAASDGAELARFESRDATTETAFVLGEFYRRQGGWKFRAVGQGTPAGSRGWPRTSASAWRTRPRPRRRRRPPGTCPGTCSATAGRPAGGAPAPSVAPPLPTGQPVASIPPPAGHGGPAPAPGPVRLTKVTLTKDAPAVSLTKQGGTSGVMRVNLNWSVGGAGKRLGKKLGRKAMEALGARGACCRPPATSTSTCARCTNSPTGRPGWCTRSPRHSATCTPRRTSSSTATTAPAPSRPARTSPSTSTTRPASDAS
ncbi:TerD family protein [Streptomyces albulus]|nr:TerD family protein [Streptomyces noursei]